MCAFPAMRSWLFRAIAVEVLVAGLCEAVDVQQNYTICNWARLRAGVVRDAVYLDGGLLWWQTAFADGTAPVVSNDGNVAGDMFRLNFSNPFDTTSTNVSGLLERMPKAGGAGNNIAPNYADGTMFTNNGELYLYGGLPRLTDSASPQSSGAILGYEAFQYGPSRASWSPGFYQGTLPEGVTRYITNGAGVSAPSENKGFYFSGMRAPDWGPIYYEDSSANATASTLVSVDMASMRNEEWTNNTLPDFVRPRANAELVWIPVSEQGILVAVGGVTAPEEIWPAGLADSQRTESEAQSPIFMTSLPVYDVASGNWYIQNTTGDVPPQLTEFCSVVATAQDSSSFNVYIYGGYNGLDAGDVPSDDVWILSIPSFTWIKAYSGSATHGRSGHACVKAYPDQMFVIGGIHQNQAICTEGGVVQVFNLNTLDFQDIYNPKVWSEYKVPSIVTAVIGGDESGGSTHTATWSDNALGALFSQQYAKQITIYYPYESNGPTTGSGGGGVSQAAIISISVVAVVIGLLLLLLIALLFRRRHRIRSGASNHSSQSSNSRVMRWLNGETAYNKQRQSTCTCPPEMQKVESSHSISEDTPQPLPPHEMAGTERPRPPFELATAYNDQSHPRHSGIVDYAYNSNLGHTLSSSEGNSHSKSSSNEYRPSPLSSGENANGDKLRPNLPQRNLSSSISDPSTSDTVAWPLPGATNTWRRSEQRSSESSSTQPIVEELDSRPVSTRQNPAVHTSASSMYRHENGSASSGIGTMPSPTRDAEHRDSLGGMVSPVSPTVSRF